MKPIIVSKVQDSPAPDNPRYERSNYTDRRITGDPNPLL